MRSLLYLGDQEHTPEISKDQVISHLGTQFSIDVEVFRRILELKTLKKHPSIPELESLFDQYLQNLQILAQTVDQIKC
jgi:hypothetical protein